MRAASIRRVLAVMGMVCAMGAMGAGVRSESDQPMEAEASCLMNFSRFIEWPSNTFQNPESPFVIGIVGNNPFGIELARIAWRTSTDGRVIEVRQLRLGDDLRSCQMLFIGWPNRKLVMQILTSVNGSSVLTVSDAIGFVNWGGMIEFSRRGDQVRFAVNDEVVKRAGMKASANLLKLASQVVERAGTENN